MNGQTFDTAFTYVLLATPVLLLVVGVVGGMVGDRRHYRSIRERERSFLPRPAVTARFLGDPRPIREARLARGSVVVSVDHFRRFLAAFRHLFGGEMHSYSSMIDRGRREAILRMKESQPDADIYLNCRLETSTICNRQGKPMARVEILAYSTAIEFDG